MIPISKTAVFAQSTARVDKKMLLPAGRSIFLSKDSYYQRMITLVAVLP